MTFDPSYSEIVTALLGECHREVEKIFSQFNSSRFCELIQQILQCRGIVFLTGVGKSGIIAQKIAATLSASGTRSLYLSSQDALHGDMGMVNQGDMVLYLSKSGESTELIDLCKPLKDKGAQCIAIVSQASSRLSSACDWTFVLPSVRELCPFDIVPTTSTMAQLIFGDLLAMALMRLKNVALQDFIQNHPSGRIGRRHLLKVCDLMVQGGDLPRCSPDDFLGDVLVELSKKRCGCVCVLGQEDRLIGIFTDGDLRRALQEHGPEALKLQMRSLMTKEPRCISPQALAVEAMRYMETGCPVTSLVVEENGICQGLVRMHDILQSGL
jgi:arabinose-5-phosphate isomerase